MKVLFSDLDNTLIYSHRHKINKPLILAEMLNGKEQSFMTERTYSFLKNQNMFSLTAVTTRTYEQYIRLKNILEDIKAKDVLICNGAFLMHDGKEDEEWTEKSVELAEKDSPYLYELLEYAKKTVSEEKTVSVMPFMFYIKVDETEKVFSLMKEKADREHLSVLKDSRKVYCTVKSINKGNAVRRYTERFDNVYSMSAGDSLFDIPMLSETDICFCPEGMEDFETKGRRITCEGLFSDSICEKIEKTGKEEKL